MTAKCDKDYFDILPNEILENIFSYLINLEKSSVIIRDDSKKTDLKAATIVCKRWNELISNSLKLMSKFVLQITDISLDDLEYPLITRLYQKCELYTIQNDNVDQCINIIRSIGSTLKDIAFHGSFPEKLLSKISVLHYCTNIHTLRMYNVCSESNFKSIRRISDADFPKLKTLNVVNRPQYVLDAFKKVDIENMQVYSETLFYFPYYNEWKIQKLEVGKTYNIASFAKFLINQKPYLKELSVYYNSSIIEFIMKEMRQLTKLKVTIHHLSEDFVSDCFIEENTCLKELTIVYKQLFMRTHFIRTMFQHYPSINTLTLDFYYGGWAFTSDNLQYNNLDLHNLTYLSINSNSNFVFLRGNFPILKSLHVNYFRKSSIYNFPIIDTLESLSVHFSSFKASTLVKFYRNLKYLKVLDGTDFTEQEMIKIIERLPKLETIVMKRYLWKINDSPHDFFKALNKNNIRVIFQNC